MKTINFVFVLSLLLITVLFAIPEHTQVNGVFPHLTVKSKGAGSDTETGIGALIPWADRLWAISYVAHKQGTGIGLYEISSDMSVRLHPESVTGTFANRLIHWDSKQAIIGPHIIDEKGNVRTFKDLAKHRLTDTMRHLFDPKNKVYFLTMEGLLFEADVYTLETRLVSDLIKEIGMTTGQPHFKGGHTAQGRVIVANNTYEEPEFMGVRADGYLAEWDGKKWTILERNPFVEVAGKENPTMGARYGNTVFATGWSRSSVILRVLHNGTWSRYLLPKASHSFDHTWNTEWMRMREVQTERYLMDIHGTYFELPPMVYDESVWGIRPIATHLRIVPDFCYWQGLLVMAGDQTDKEVGQPQSNLWFGNIDDLWSMGKPGGWGGPWWDTEINAGAISDPFLMTGYDKKVLHLKQESDLPVEFTVQVDFLGNGEWCDYTRITVPANGYKYHVFPDGFSAHWVRIIVVNQCKATAYFFYN